MPYRTLAPLCLVATACLVALTLAPPALAASSRSFLLGSSLAVDSPCARHVTIEVAADLHGMADISATADHQEEIDRLVTESKDSVRIRTVPGGCWQHGERPTLQLAIRVPPDFPLSIDESGAGDYTIGDTGSPMKLNLSGAAHLASSRVTELAAEIGGAGDVHVTRVDGSAQIDLSGAGRIDIGQAAMPAMNVELSGAGSVDVHGGQIGALKLDNSGFGSIRIDAVAGNAELDVSGAGSIELKKVTGAIHKEVSGIGSVHVGG